MSTIATIRFLCEANPSLGTAIVNGVLAWAATLGGFTVFFTGLPAVLAIFIPDKADTLSKQLNRWLGVGFILGMGGGLLMFFVFIARVAS